MILIYLFYIFNLILSILCIKAINYFFEINNIIFACIIYGHFFPFSFIYSIYSNTLYHWINIFIGFLDYLQVIFLYIGINELSIAEYIAFRTLSIAFNFLLSIFFLKKEFCRYQKTGIGFITLSSIILLVKGESHYIYGFIILLSSFIYSIIGFLMEYYKDICEFSQIKLISSFFCITTYTVYSFINPKSIDIIDVKKSFNYSILYFQILIWTMILFIGASEYIYYYLKQRITNQIENGSIYISILDIIRRVFTLILGLILFKEKYEDYLYWCFALMILGCILFHFNKKIKEYIDKIDKIRGFHYFDQNINTNNLNNNDIKIYEVTNIV